MGAMDSKGFSCWVEGGVMQIRGKREVCGNAGDQARKFVHPSRVHYDRLCLNYSTRWEAMRLMAHPMESTFRPHE